ncbi:MAG: sodium/sugar symporter [Gammaproteobacteria bacterium]|nr:sodium/sugar symporter [Gammaproteobacteria bacterium]
MQLATIDIVIIAVYAVAIVSLATWVSRDSQGHKKDTNDYFLAGKALPWWAIGASLIAANISAEQIIGMSGSGYVIGLAIASYEWMSAITIIIVGKYFLPIFLRNNICTMPQYLQQRYDRRVCMLLAVFWLGVYVFVNLTSILWLGALAINSITGMDYIYGLLLLGLLAAAYSLYGGLKAIALTDIIQVVLLIFGGLLISLLSLQALGQGAGVVAGFTELLDRAPEKFDLILTPDNPHYISLPGISVLVGGMWIMNLSYWGFNQYIIQRALAARSLREAQKGIAFAAYLKLLMPVIVVLPGIAAFVLAPGLAVPDQAYPEMMKLVPAGLRGLVFAALIAAILSSIGSMVNSISTISTMDIYRHLRPDADERQLVIAGRCIGFAALALGMICAKPLLGNFDQAFQYIQEFTGFFTPGIVVIFLLGMFWKGMNSHGAMTAAVGSALLSFALKLLWPALPFIDRVGLVFLLCVMVAVGCSLSFRTAPQQQGDVVDYRAADFATSPGFNAATGGVILILAALYATWW